MERQNRIAEAPELSIPVRVRGLSQDEKYFDELTSTSRVNSEFIVLRLRERVDVETELHVTNLKTVVGGTFRVTWTGTVAEDGLYFIGLDLVDPDGEIWEPGSIPKAQDSGETARVVLLECQRCFQRVSTALPQVEPGAIGEGFSIARGCDACKATTNWLLCAEGSAEEEAPRVETVILPNGTTVKRPMPPAKESVRGRENRVKGRAPIKMGIKITRVKWGIPTHDVCETINVSRTGVYFTTEQGYDPGEVINVILNYHPNSMDIPVKARVIRQEERPGTYQKRVAIHLLAREE